MRYTPRTHRALGLAALTATALLLSSCSTTADLLGADSVAQAVTDGGSALDPTAAHVLTITNATAMTLAELPENTDPDAANNTEPTMAQSALKRIYGLEIAADGTLIAVAAPLTSRNSGSEQLLSQQWLIQKTMLNSPQHIFLRSTQPQELPHHVKILL